MTRLIVDATLPSILPAQIQPVELCDAQGRVLGRYFPTLDPSKYNLEPQISKEEALRRKQSQEKSYTTAEVLAHLEKL